MDTTRPIRHARTAARLLAAVLALLPLLPQAAELVVNGSFEEPAVTAVPASEYLPGDGVSVTGWQTVLAGVERFDPGIHAVGSAYDGQLAIDLTNDYALGGGLLQTIDTVPGQAYVLTFMAATWQGAGRDGRARITVSAGDRSQLFMVVNPQPTLRWQRCRLLFHAYSVRTTVAFLNFSNPGEDFSLVDAVSVMPAP